MIDLSLGILVALGIQIFVLVSIAFHDCDPVKKHRKVFFKWFLSFLILKHFFNMGVGIMYVFIIDQSTKCQSLETMSIQVNILFDLAICANLFHLSYPAQINDSSFLLFNQLGFVMVASISNFIQPDDSFLLVFTASVMVIVLSFSTCNVEVSIIFCFYATSFILEAWLGSLVAIIFRTVLWSCILIWFTIDRRDEIPELRYSPPENDHGLQTIELN